MLVLALTVLPLQQQDQPGTLFNSNMLGDPTEAPSGVMTADLRNGSLFISESSAKPGYRNIWSEVKDGYFPLIGVKPLLQGALYFVLPFLAGGFHSHVSFVTSWVLFFQLLRLYRENKSLSFVLNINSLSVLMLVAAYAVAPLWAASRGMAMYGLLRYLPLLLYILLLMHGS